MKRFIVLFVLLFLLGWFSNSVYSSISLNEEFPFVSAGGVERASPQNIIRRSDISVENDKVIINVKDVSIAAYADTNSMDPLLDKGTIGIEIVPECNKLKKGDVIAYRSKLTNDLIVHRIIVAAEDREGIFFRLKGDNNALVDSEKVRCDQVEYQLVGVLY